MSVGFKFRQDPFLALALLTLVVGTIWILAIQPFFTSTNAATRDLEAAEARIASLNSRLEALGLERDGLVSIDASSAQWQGAQIGAISAEVQSRLTRLARSARVNLRAITPLPSASLAGQAAVTLRLEGEADLAQIVAFIQSLERNQPLIILDHTILRRLNRPDDGSAQPLVFFQLSVLAPVFVTGAS